MKDVPVFVSTNDSVLPESMRAEEISGCIRDCRIPSLVTGGRIVVAACDKANSGADWGYIGINVSLSYDSGKSFEKPFEIFMPPLRKMPLSFDDYSSAFAIDPSMAVTENDEILMVFDFYPESKGLHNTKLLDNIFPYKTINGKKYQILLNNNSNKEFTVRENGRIFDENGEMTNYYLPQIHNSEYRYSTIGDMYYIVGDADYIDKAPPLMPENDGIHDIYVGNIYLNFEQPEFLYDKPQFVQKYYSDLAKSLMPETSSAPLRSPVCNYIYIMKSKNGGKTWSQPEDITKYVRLESDDNFLGVTPGNSIETSNGRIIFPIYSVGTSFTIYSDDGGKKFFRGAVCKNIDECSLVEYSDGSIGCFGRPEITGDIPYSISCDNLKSWKIIENNLYSVKCQHSVISVPKRIYNTAMDKNFDYILCSRPTGHCCKDETRTTGMLSIGKVNSDKTIEWIKSIPIKNDEIYLQSSQWHDFFAYSSMSVLPDGRIGILYEPFPSGYIAFTSVSLDDFFKENI